jgi:HlyD family secretion protein
MTANVTVQLQRHEDVLRVPNAALRFRPPMAPEAGRGAMAANANGANGRSGSGGAAGARGAEAAMRDTSRAGGGQRGHRGGGGGEGASGAGGWRRNGGAGSGDVAGRSLRHGGATDSAGTMSEAPQYRPGAIYVLKDGKPSRLQVMTGISDGAFTEVRGDGVAEGMKVIVGLDLAARGQNLQPPPGMGGPGFRGPGGGGGGGGRPR